MIRHVIVYCALNPIPLYEDYFGNEDHYNTVIELLKTSGHIIIMYDEKTIRGSAVTYLKTTVRCCSGVVFFS